MSRSTVNDMTEGPIWKHLVKFAFPLFIGNIFQQLYNTVDSIVVGNFVGADALGAVTSTIPIVITLIGLAIGFTMGASVVISQYFGARDTASLRRSTHTATAAMFLLSLIFAAAGYFATPGLLHMMNTPESVFREAVVYLRIFSLGLTGTIMYNMGSAILRAVGDSKRPLYFLILASILNIFLDLLFVIRFGLGVAGVAYATIIAQFVSGMIIFWLLFRSHEVYSLRWHEMRIDTGILRRIIAVGFPAGFQMAVTSFSNVFVQAYINAYGAASTAGWGIYSRIDAFVILPTQSMAMSVTTFVGQNAGARRPDRIHRGLITGLCLSWSLSACIIMVLYIFAPVIAGLFNQDVAVLGFAVLFIRLNSLFDPVNATNQIEAGALRGVGDSRTPMMIMLMSFVVFRQVYLFVISRLTETVHFIAFGYPLGWMVCTALMTIHIVRAGWEKKIAALR